MKKWLKRITKMVLLFGWRITPEWFKQNKRVLWFGLRMWNIRNLNLTGVITLVIHENRVLLINKKLGVDPGWQIPGGGLKRGKLPEEGALDELHEETGIRVAELELLDIFSSPKDRNLAIIYIGHGLVGSVEPCVQDTFEISEARWVPIKEALENLIELEPHRRFLEKAIRK